MKTSIFQSPYEKVFRRTRNALSRLGIRILSFDALRGNIQAVSRFSLNKPVMEMELFFEEMDNHDTKITIHGLTVKKHFFQSSNAGIEQRELEIMENIAVMV